MYNIADLDIDCADRDKVLSCFENIPASKITPVGIIPHGVGVYFCNIPKDELTGLSSIDYKRAEEEFGFFKIDLLHNTTYDKYTSRTELFNDINKPIKWEMLNNEEFVTKLPHIGSYYSLMRELPIIDSIEKLAMFISVIRPGKNRLIDVLKASGQWESIEDVIWVKEDTGYMYKKSHAISYAMMITLHMR